MACSPGHCTSNCYSFGCSVNAPACSSNATSFGVTVTSSHDIAATHVNDLRISIDNERTTRRGKSADFPTSVDTDDTVDASHADDMKDSINEMVVMAGDSVTAQVTDTYVIGDVIEASDINNLRSKINELRADCVCDSDCGANAVCTCHGDCECNYSDKRLKQNIKYL